MPAKIAVAQQSKELEKLRIIVHAHHGARPPRNPVAYLVQRLDRKLGNADG
jgi:hypothetical protein